MNRIKELRNEKGLTQTELGKLIGVDCSGVSKYESESYAISDDILRKLSEVLDSSIDYLLCKSGKRYCEDSDSIQVAFSNGMAGLNDYNRKLAVDIIASIKSKQEMEEKK